MRTSRLRVLHIISGLETGGAETSLARLVLATRDDIEHVVVSLTGMGTQGSLLQNSGIRVVALNWRRGRVSIAGVFRLVSLARSLSPDVVQGWMYHANIIATLVALACGKHRALVWSVRHSLDDMARESRSLKIVIRASASLSRAPVAILFNSERSRMQHIAAGFAMRGTVTIANGVDTSRFAPDATMRSAVRAELGIPDSVPVVGMVARVHPLKGHALFLDAVVHLRRHIPGLRVLLAGRGTEDESGAVFDRIQELGIGDIVHRLGDRCDVEAVYNACDLTVLASSSEAFPNAVVESMSCGVPCIATDVGDAAMIVGESLRVVPHGFPTALASACVTALNGLATDASSMKRAVRQRVLDNFSLDRATSRYLALWQHLANASVRKDLDTLAGAVTTSVATPDERQPRRKVLHVLTASMSLHFLRGQREWLRERGIELHVACSPGAELDAWRSVAPGTAHAVPMRRAIAPFADLAALVHLVRLVRRERFDVVHAGTPKGGLLGTLAAWICRVPLRVYHVRGLPLATTSGLSRVLLSATERVAAGAATRVVAVSNSLRAELADHRLCMPEAIRVIGAGSSNGVDAHVRFNRATVDVETVAEIRRRHGIPQDSVVIGFVGRFTRDKGIAELVGAWRTLRAAHVNVHLLVVGDADDASGATLDAMAALRSDPRAHLHGADWNTPALYATMDVLVLPTYREGFPNVLLEAAAMSIPVVATSVAGCVDAVVHESTGLLVAPRDVAALAAALSRYVADPSMRKSHGESARQRVLRLFDQSVIWNGLRELYETGDVRHASVEPSPTITRHAA